MLKQFWCRFNFYVMYKFYERLEIVGNIQYQTQIILIDFSITKSRTKQTVLGAKYSNLWSLCNTMKINVYTAGKANQKFNDVNLYPLFLFTGANFSQWKQLLFFPHPDISPKIMLITQNHLLGDGFGFVTNIIADYVTTDFPVMVICNHFNKRNQRKNGQDS
jgi:hypothetical protein